MAVALLTGLALLAWGTPPGAAETGPQVVQWFQEHRDGVQWFVWALTVSALPTAVMFAQMRRLLPTPHRDVFFIGAVSYVVAGSIQTWIWGGLALHAGELDPAIARSLLDVAVFFGPVFTGTTTTMMAPVTILALRGQARLPWWLGALGTVAFIEQAIETFTIFGSTGFTQPGGAMNLQLGAGLTLAWILSFGVWGGLRGRAQDRWGDGLNLIDEQLLFLGS